MNRTTTIKPIRYIKPFTISSHGFALLKRHVREDVPVRQADVKAASMFAFVAAGGDGIEGSVTTEAFTTAAAREMFTAPERSPAATSLWAQPDGGSRPVAMP